MDRTPTPSVRGRGRGAARGPPSPPKCHTVRPPTTSPPSSDPVLTWPWGSSSEADSRAVRPVAVRRRGTIGAGGSMRGILALALVGCAGGKAGGPDSGSTGTDDADGDNFHGINDCDD